MGRFEPINSTFTLLAMLTSPNVTSTVEYRQTIGDTFVYWTKEELLKKSLADLIALANNKMYFRIINL